MQSTTASAAAAATRTQLPTSRRICKAIISPSPSSCGPRAHTQNRRFGIFTPPPPYFPSPFFFAEEQDLFFPPSTPTFPMFRLLDTHQPNFRITRRHRQPHPHPHSHFLKVMIDSASALTAAAPRFDVRERTAAYELQGEVPGLRHEDVVVEFLDQRTLRIKGRRRVESNESKESKEEESGTDVNVKGKNTEGNEKGKGKEKLVEAEAEAEAEEGVTTQESGVVDGNKTKSQQQATVEDEDEDWEEVQATATGNAPAPAAEDDKSTTIGANTPINNPSPSSSSAAASASAAPAQPEITSASQSQSQSQHKYKYWLTERLAIEQFERRFKFPADVDVDQEAVKASLKNGILRVVVPKIVKKEEKGEKGRRIVVE